MHLQIIRYLILAPLGNSDQVRVGDVVLAIGNPLGVGQTVTMGIISAKGRQTGLSHGSGRALVNTSGELIGIKSQTISASGGNIGIGFAVPANMAKSVMAQLTNSGTVRRGMLGVTVQPVTSDLAFSLGLSDVRGALISSVQHGGPADRAGVQRGDVILALNGSPVADSNALRN
jgi:S1-C subfamily serine protease